MATAYAYLVLMPATLLLAPVNSVDWQLGNAMFSTCLSVGYDTVEHAKYRCKP